MDKLSIERKRQEINAADLTLRGRGALRGMPGVLVGDPDDLDIPEGSNSSDARSVFEERLFFREAALKQYENAENGIGDYWHSNQSYSLVNRAGYAVYPSSTFLKQFTTSTGTAFALNFVVDAFEEMVKYCESYLMQAPSALSRAPSSIIPFNVFKGWESPRKKYHSHIEKFYDAFTNGYLGNFHSKILDFEDFLSYMIEFMDLTVGRNPFTFSSFVGSSLNSRLTSGLALEISGVPYDDDVAKFAGFYDDSKFELYRRAAQIHGFIIDKNIPFRLYANLDHSKMKEGIKRNILFVNKFSVDSFYNSAYYLAHREDIMHLKFHAASMYDNYVNFFPSVELSKRLQGCKSIPSKYTQNVTGTGAKLHYRNRLDAYGKGGIKTSSDYYRKYNDLFWIRFYYKLLMKESGMGLTSKQCDKKVRKYYNTYRSHGINKTVDKIVQDIRVEKQKIDFKVLHDELKTTVRPAKPLLPSKKGTKAIAHDIAAAYPAPYPAPYPAEPPPLVDPFVPPPRGGEGEGWPASTGKPKIKGGY